ncbi:MAG: hypothetical protein ACYS1A_13855 [Planctomycetota bacterium]
MSTVRDDCKEVHLERPLMTGFRCDCGKIIATLSGDIKYLTKFVDKLKIQRCEPEGSKEQRLKW